MTIPERNCFMTTERDYGIDLLRILSMLMICLVHILGQGGILNNPGVEPRIHRVLWFFECIAYCAVNCYALISGYVGLNARHRFANLLSLWLQVLFYSFGIALIYRNVLQGDMSRIQLLGYMMPVAHNKYWYITSYFGMFFFLPLVNSGVQALPKHRIRSILLALMVLFSCLPRLLNLDPFSIKSGYSPLWLLFLYLLGAYIKRYAVPSKTWPGCLKWIGVYLLSTLVTWVYTIGPERVIHSDRTSDIRFALLNYTSPTMLLCAISLLLAFANLPPVRRKIIKKLILLITPATLSVYLIHTHPVVWEKIVRGCATRFAGLPLPGMLLGILFSCFLLFTVCVCIDILRLALFRLVGVQPYCERCERMLLRFLNPPAKQDRG